jgi:alpha-glucosidase
MSNRPLDRRKVLLAGGVALAPLPTLAKPRARSIEAVSPDGALSVRLAMGSTGPIWSVIWRNQTILAPSALGLILADGRVLGDGARLMKTSARTITGTWAPPFGIRARYDQACREARLDLVDPATGATFSVLARAYDHGCALRYVLNDAGKAGRLTLSGEATRFELPKGAKLYASRDEGEYQITAASGLNPPPHPDLTGSSDKGPFADLPVTVMLGHAAVLIAESDRLHYPRAMLRSASGSPDGLAVHLMHYPARATGYSGPGDTPAEPTFELAPGQATPWRALIVGPDAGSLLERADLIPTLATPNRLGDVSWVRPGRAVRVRKPYSTEGALKVVDFAQARKLEYIEFDAHWYGDGTDPSDASYPVEGLDMRKVIDVAKAKGIGVILYVDRVPVMRQRDQILAAYREWGVAGCKFGFVWEGRQSDSDFIYDLVKACGEHRLLVNLHDNLRPAGLERTLPNYVALEGVRGNEQFPTATHNVILPFTRAVAGPIDYTICYANEKNRTTNAHQLAMAAVYYNPLTFLYWYDAPEKYADRAWPELRWFDECPTTWGETKVLAGEIGEYIVVARRHGQRWFLGAMTNEKARVLKVKLDFLGAGKRKARVFADGAPTAKPMRTPVEIREVVLDGSATLTLDLAPSGGQAVLFEAVSKSV